MTSFSVSNPSSTTLTTVSDPVVQSSDSEVTPVPNKRKKWDENKIEDRIGGILCCSVCLDLPPDAVYQCTNGHLMCVGCFMHLLADAKLRDETSTCPNCRVEISRTSAVRNLAVEKAVLELPGVCSFCSQTFPRHSLAHHEKDLCQQRLVDCKYKLIGCVWRGALREKEEHIRNCVRPQLKGAELLPVLQTAENTRHQRELYLNQIFDYLSFEKIAFTDIQLKAYRTEEYIHQLYYESTRFSAFGQQWVVKAKIVSPVKDPTQAAQRSLAYQLTLKSRSPTAMAVHYLVLKGPYGDLNLIPAIYHFEFQSTDANNKLESNWENLPSALGVDCNEILSNKTINLRVVMFCGNK